MESLKWPIKSFHPTSHSGIPYARPQQTPEHRLKTEIRISLANAYGFGFLAQRYCERIRSTANAQTRRAKRPDHRPSNSHSFNSKGEIKRHAIRTFQSIHFPKVCGVCRSNLAHIHGIHGSSDNDTHPKAYS